MRQRGKRGAVRARYAATERLRMQAAEGLLATRPETGIELYLRRYDSLAGGSAAPIAPAANIQRAAARACDQQTSFCCGAEVGLTNMDM